MRERSDIMRDLHDSLLQSLTAARTHLEILSRSADQSQEVLPIVRELLRIEQQRVREFVDASLAGETDSLKSKCSGPLPRRPPGLGLQCDGGSCSADHAGYQEDAEITVLDAGRGDCERRAARWRNKSTLYSGFKAAESRSRFTMMAGAFWESMQPTKASPSPKRRFRGR